MSEYQDTMNRLEEMRSRYDDGFSSSDRQFLDRLYYSLFVKAITNTGCSDCYRDAYILCVNKLKRLKSMPKKPNYILKAGAMIHPVGTSKFYTNPITDEVAEDWLSKYPGQIGMFAEYPEDWEERVAKYAEALKAERSAEGEVSGVEDTTSAELETVKTELQAEKEENATLRAELEATKALLAEAEAKVAEKSDDNAVVANEELEKAKAEIAELKEENAKLKTDNRALKAANTRLKKGDDAEEAKEDADKA